MKNNIQKLKLQESSFGYEKKIFKVFLFVFFCCLNTVDCQNIMENRLVHINYEKAEFSSGAISSGNFKINFRCLKKKNNFISIKGQIINKANDPLGFFNFYLVELKDSITYKIIKNIGAADINGQFKIKSKVKPNQEIFVTCEGFMVKSFIPGLLNKRKLILKE